MKSIVILFTLVGFGLMLGTDPVLAKPGNGKGKDKSFEPGKGKGKGKGKEKGKPTGNKHGKGKKAPSAKPIPPGHAKKHSRTDHEPDKMKDWRVHARFQDQERQAIQTHFERYKRHPHGLPPGLAKKLAQGKSLPPGWEKKLHEGWIIDDGWWNYFNPVPSGYLPSSLQAPPDTAIYLIGNRLVRVHRPRRQVIDIIRIASLLANP